MNSEEWKSPANLNSVNKYIFNSINRTKKDVIDVTIAIPTYKRLNLLKRTISSVANQSYSNIHLILSSNEKSSEEKILEICKEFSQKIKKITVYIHYENIGQLGNFKFLLDSVDTEFFMWLADDDEISSNYIENLIIILQKNPDISSAMGRWVSVSNSGKKLHPKQPDLSSKILIVRIFNFIVNNDDSWFYGLHRKNKVRQCKFEGYFWPNKGLIPNWSYVFLIEILIKSPVLYSHSADFINHDYGIKFYPIYRYGKIINLVAYIVRRANLYGLFSYKLFKDNYKIISFLLIPVYLILLGRDFFKLLYSIIINLIRRYKDSIKT